MPQLFILSLRFLPSRCSVSNNEFKERMTVVEFILSEYYFFPTSVKVSLHAVNTDNSNKAEE